MKRRLLAVFMVLALLVGLMPMGALAAPGETQDSVTNTKNNVTVNKSVSGSQEDGYTLTLEAYASNKITTVPGETTPLDIVLVLDTSGSMAESFGDGQWEYNADQRQNWSASHLVDWYDFYYNNIAESNYYVEVDGEYYQVCVLRTRYGSGYDSYYTYQLGYYTEGEQWKTLSDDASWDEERYQGTLYTRRYSSTTKLQAMKDAVNGFIGDVIAQNNENSISIVSFDSSANVEEWLISDPDDLKDTVDRLGADGGTQADDGLDEANNVLDTIKRESKKVVVLFTDGEPGDYGFTDSVASRAVNTAKGMKDDGVTIYTVGIFDGANPNADPNGYDISDANEYMQAVSSNYPEAKVTSWSWGSEHDSNDWDDLNLGTGSYTGGYYLSADNPKGLDNVFEGLAGSITQSTLEVYPDAEAVMTDTLSSYFNFPADLLTVDGSVNMEAVSVYTVDAVRVNTDGEVIQWASTPGNAGDVAVTINGDTINITGFDYVNNAVTEQNGSVKGCKLVVEFPIELDETTITETGVYPTNNTSDNKAGLKYKADKDSQFNDESTLLDDSPSVDVKVADPLNGTAVTIEVYVDGEKVTDPLARLSLARQGSEYTAFDTTVDADGTITADFNINPNDEVNNDCVDIIISDIDNRYVLDSIEYNQSLGSGSPQDVRSGSGSYTVDNVADDTTSGSGDVDMKIYLSSRYTVEYYVNEQKNEGLSNTSDIYVAYRADGSGKTNDAPTDDSDSNRFWQNSGLSTSFTLPTYTTATGQEFVGWYLGSMNNGDRLAAETLQYITEEADAADTETDYVIKYYGETQTTTGTLTVTKTVSGLTGTDKLDEDFAIAVTGPNGYSNGLSISGASTTTNEDGSTTYTWEIAGVPAGEYTAREENYTVSGYTHSGTTTDTETLAAGGSAALELTNSYTKQYTVTVTVVNGSVRGENLGDDTDDAENTETYKITVNAGDTRTYTFTADTGYALDTVVVNGSGVDHTNFSEYTFENISDDQEIVVTYGIDSIGPDGPDGIPDSHQAVVTYKVENGTWDGSDNAAKVYVFTVETYNPETGKWTDSNVTLDNTVPDVSLAQPTQGYISEGADWDTTPTSETLVPKTGATYTYKFTTEAQASIGVDKTVYSINGSTEIGTGTPTAKVDDTIVYKIVVTNNGNVALEGVSVTDPLVGTLYSDEGCTSAAATTNLSLAVDGTATFYAQYTVTAADATNESVTNTATASVTDGPSDSATATVTVTPQYTLTVNSYYESTSGTLFDTDTYTLDAGANWSVVIRPETDGTHVAPATVTDDDGNNYVFDEDLSDDDLTGTIGREDVTVNLVYSLDNWKDDETDDSETGGDGEPDYKQALIKYVVAEGQDSYGDVTPAIQVETLTDEDEDGTYTGNVTASSIATANEDYAFDYWTDPDGETSWNAELSDNFTATGGGEYTYTAYFDTDTNNDDIPDKYQVFVNFKSADENGSVRGNTFQVFTLRDENGNPTQSGNITPAEVTTVANENYQFDIWTEGTGETSVDPFAERQVEGGDTITFYAHFKGTNSVYTLDKALSAVDGATVPENYKAQVGDVLTYTITVTNEGNTVLENIILTDTFNGAGELDFGTIAEDAGYSVTPGEDGTATITITSLEVGESIAIVYTYTVVADDIGDVTDDEITILTNTVSSDTDGDDTPDITDEVEVNMDTYTVEIAPANIVVYTGGDPYGGITNEEGDLVVEEDDIEANGLPEPGYHIELSQAVMDWLNIEIGEEGARDLTGYLSFQYQDDVYQREWKLEYMGVYSTDPMRYVYSMYPTDPSNPEVRVVYTDAAGIEHFDDDITMDENTVYADYTMRIYGGELEQHDIVAVLTVNDESILAGVDIGEGTLTIRSTTNFEYVNDLGTDTDDVIANDGITAVHNDSNSYYVNDTQVEIDTERVQLLVDEVSNSASFNAEMGDDAISHVEDTLDVNLRDADYELKYMDLVDNANGNTVINMDGSLTIYWPVPDDAEGDEFYVVHYTDMDRSSISDASDLAGANKEIINDVDVVRINGQEYVTFTTNSFSPFALVYETDDGRRPNVPDPDDEEEVDEPDRDYEPKWLNTEDHFAYIVGYEDGEVKPNNNITRAEVATIFFRLLTDEARADFWSQENDYSDVSATDWFNNAVSTLSNAGIIDGYEDGTFRPNAPITRAEFTAIATRFFDYTAEYEGAFNDVSYSSWYADYVQAAVDMGLVDGYEDGGFHPDSYITRAEAVTIVNRVLGRVPHEDHLLDEDEMNVWPDNLYGAWYYADIQEATNSHDYDWIRVDSETVERWTDKLTERDWEALEQEWSSAYSG